VSGLRERAQARAWTSSAERVEILAGLSALLVDEDVTRATAIHQATKLLGDLTGDASVISLLTEDRGCVLPVAAHHPDPAGHALLQQGMVGLSFRTDEGFIASVVDDREPLLIPRVSAPEVRALQPELAEVCERMGMTGFIIAPLAVGGRFIGLLSQIRTSEEPWLSLDDRRFLCEVSVRLAVGLESWPEAS
jgi:GAF domain-containing protein